MANSEHLAKLKEGIKVWNEWRSAQGEGAVVPDLSEADLRTSDLTGANLVAADLRRADLSGALLDGADLIHSEAGGARFVEAKLIKADLEGADLSRADLSGADLYRANLSRASLKNADLTAARIGTTIFVDNDLSTTKGLETIEHTVPSVIGIDTIYNSRGNIPEAFLRGCGVPENFITYMSSLTRKAFEFYSCFISYSTKDQQFADRLYADLQNKGVRCWFAPHDVQGGKKLHEQIDDAIRRYERLLLILSPNSMKSQWVETEIRNARNRELAERKRVLFPVRLTRWDDLKKWRLFNADEGRDLATEIREYYIPDFSEWKDHDSYQKEFEKLLRDLRTDGAKSA